MKKNLFFLALCALLLTSAATWARDMKPRLVFEKNLFAEGVDPKARHLDQLMVKFFDEDSVRIVNGKLTSIIGRNTLSYTHDFLARHPEIKPRIIISEPEASYAERQRWTEQFSGQTLVDLFSFYCFTMETPAADPHALLAEILKAPEVEQAYYEPIPAQACADLGSVTPNLIPEQHQYDAAPAGVGLAYVQGQFGADVVDGTYSTWTAVVEYNPGFTYAHEDFNSPVNATPEGPLDATSEHATAVMGILGACKANNVGCLGLLADEEMRGYGTNALPNVADVYNRVNSNLIAGEVCNSSWGYFSSPMPPGQSCPCNPGQNGMVPIEYNSAIKSAVQAGVLAGKHFFESAGNGCTNLDAAVYGNTFRWAADVGSCYVGAITSGVPHNASCFTCFGEKVTLCNWGENVTTTGYGGRWSGAAGRNEYYTNGFNGTSSASPLTCGDGGILNNLYRNNNAGANISPSTMRSWLAYNGTAPVTVPGNIGVMPNLFGITGPNLYPYYAAGWTYPTVPRNTADATSGSVVLPASLNSEPNATYWNRAAYNSSLFATVSEYSQLYLDDNYFIYAGGTLIPNQWNWAGNIQSNVRGGRHTVRQTEDPLFSVQELNEGDNNFVHQFVWTPRDMTSDAPLTFSRPPTKVVTSQPNSIYNVDAYRGTTGFSGWWQILAVLGSTSSADYDARVYDYHTAISSEAGLDAYQKWSSQVGPVDFVGVDRNNDGSAVLVASALNWNADYGNYIAEAQSSVNTGTPPYGRHLITSKSIASNAIFDNWEFYADVANIPYVIEVEATSGNADVAISLMGTTNVYFQATDRVAYQNANGAGQGEILSYTPTVTGWYGVVVHKVDYNSYSANLSYNLYIGKGQADLTHYPLSGWTNQVVVTQTPASTPVVVPSVLAGNVFNNYFSASYKNVGYAANPAGTVQDRIYVDRISKFTTGTWSSWAPNATTYWLNLSGNAFIYGGRHAVADSIDVFKALPEWREDNNRFDAQYVWSPYPMNNFTSYWPLGNVAPNWSDFTSPNSFPAYNQDGYRFTGGSHWTGVAATPNSAADDYDLGLYYPSTGSQNGFDAALINSWSGGDGETEFIVENGNLNGTATYDVGIFNNWAYPSRTGNSYYFMQQCNSIQDLTMGVVNGSFYLPGDFTVQVFDLDLTAGSPTRIWLENLGTLDLSIAVISADATVGSRSSYLAYANATSGGGDELVQFTPTASGRHAVVVYRSNGTDLATGGSYNLHVGNGAPAAPTGLVTKVIDSSTDPIQIRLYWDPVTTDAAGLPMTPEYYQMYYTFTSGYDAWPTDWTAYSTTTDDSLDVYVASFVPYFRTVVVAVDNDGMILGSSPMPDGTQLRGIHVDRPVAADKTPPIIGRQPGAMFKGSAAK